MKLNRLGAALALTTVVALTGTACAANEAAAPAGGTGSSAAASLTGELKGIGASSAASAQEAWAAKFQTTYPDVSVNYSPDGSGAGREAFAGGGADFAGSDRAMKVEEMTADALAKSRCDPSQGAMNLPVYISPIAVIYNVEGVTDLKLDADTLASIFAGKITKWNDSKIAALNNGVDLPATNITAVHRSDDSGTTENFTDYLHANAPEAWSADPDGVWPIKGGEAAAGTSGVIDTVTNGTGTIGYADASKAGDLGVAKIKVGSEFVEYTPERASAIVDESPEDTSGDRSEHDIAIVIDRKATGDVYPIVLVSYAIACEKYKDAATGAKVKAYLSYIGSTEGQQEAASKAGSAPLSDKLSQQVSASVASIS